MGRRVSDERQAAIVRDLLHRLPRVSGKLDGEHRHDAARALVEAVHGPGWRERGEAIGKRALDAAVALAVAREQDGGEPENPHTLAWIDTWILSPDAPGLTDSEVPDALRTRLLARQRDVDRRTAMRREGAHAARVVLSPTAQTHVQGLRQVLEVATQQELIELALAAVYAVYEPVVDHRVDQAEGLAEADSPAPPLRSWKQAIATARARVK